MAEEEEEEPTEKEKAIARNEAIGQSISNVGSATYHRSTYIAKRATTSKVFGILFLSFIVNTTAKFKPETKMRKVKATDTSDAGVDVVEQSDVGAFLSAVVSANLPAWAILLIVLTVLADNPTTGQVAYGLAILIFLGSVLVNGDKAAKNIGVIVSNWGKGEK